MINYNCPEPSLEGFWESFFRNGPILAIIHKFKARLDIIKKKCELFIANPKQFDNHDGHNSINALKILPREDEFKLLMGLYQLGEVIKKDVKDMANAKEENYIKALETTGIKVKYDKVKEQYTWEPHSLFQVLIVDALATVFTAGLYGVVNLLTGNGVSRAMQSEVSELPGHMNKKGYESTEDYVDLCRNVVKLLDQAKGMEKIKPEESKTKCPEKRIEKLVASAIKVYNLEVKEVCYSMVKVLMGLDSKHGWLAEW